MQEIFVKSISNEECALKTTEDVHASHLCAENSFGEGLCKGDSGNPLVSNGELLVGIASLTDP